MTKSSRLSPDAIVDLTPPGGVVRPTQEKPFKLTINAGFINAFAEAAVHIRNGYIFDPVNPVEVFAYLGQVSITLVTGTPGQAETKAAAQTVAQAIEANQLRSSASMEQQEARQRKAVAEALAAAQRSVLIEDRKAKIAALQAEIAAAT